MIVEARSETCGVEYAKHAKYAKQAMQASSVYQLYSCSPILRMKLRGDTSKRIECLDLIPSSVLWDFALYLRHRCQKVLFDRLER